MLTIIFFHCTRFTNKRLQMIHSTRNLHPLNCELLLFGMKPGMLGKTLKQQKLFTILSNELNVLHNALHPFNLPYLSIAFLLLFILYCHSFRPISFLCTNILLLLAIYALNCLSFSPSFVIYRYFPQNYTVMYMCKK